MPTKGEITMFLVNDMLTFTPTTYLPLGPLKISTHALMMVIGIFTTYFLARREVKMGRRLSVDILDNLINWMVVGGIIGARLGYVLLNPRYYTHFLDIFKIWQGGLVSFGGVIGGFIGALLYLRGKKIDWVSYADILAPYILLGWGIGRIGDFLAWEEFGTATTLPWGIDAGFGVVRHPVQLYTFLTLTIGFFIVQRLKRTPKAMTAGYIFVVSGIYYFTERFLMEFLRDDIYGAAQLISYRYFAQGASLGLILALLSWFTYRLRKNNSL